MGKQGVTLEHLPALGRDVHIVHDIRAFFQLIRTLRKARPDILHLNSSKAGGLGALAGRISRVPRIVFTSHGLPYDEDRSFVSRLFIFIATWVTFALCHKVICISHNTYERAHRIPLVGKKVRFVRNGIRPFTVLPRDEARSHLISAHSVLKKDGVWIGAIAELVRNKGLAFAVGALAHMEKSDTPAFIVIGEGDERRNLTEAISTAKLDSSFVLAGFVSDARELLSAFDIFALPSVKEGLPYTLLEAGLARLPVVASDIPGIEDIIEHGVTGLLVPSHDPEALARALTRLKNYGPLRVRLGSALYEKVSAHFSPEIMLAGTIALYRE